VVVDEAPRTDERTLALREGPPHGHRAGPTQRHVAGGDDFDRGTSLLVTGGPGQSPGLADYLLGTGLNVAHGLSLAVFDRRGGGAAAGPLDRWLSFVSQLPHRADLGHELEDLLRLGVGDIGESGEDDLRIRLSRLGAELLPRLGEGDEYPAVVFRVGCLGHEPAPLEFAEQTAERTAAHHQTAQQVALPDLRRGRRIDEHIELIGAEPMAGPELVFEPRHEVLILL